MRAVGMRHVHVQDQRVVVGKARDDAPVEAPDAEHLAPVPPVDAHRGPPVGPGGAEARAGVVLERARQLARVELRVLEPAPPRLDVERVGVEAEAQVAVHVGAELEFRARCR